MTNKTYKKSEIQYFIAQTGNYDCIKHGSFVRWSKKYGFSRFILGDFHGFLDKLPEGMMEIDRTIADQLLPKCCK